MRRSASSFITTTIREKRPRSHHKGATGMVQTGNQRCSVLFYKRFLQIRGPFEESISPSFLPLHAVILHALGLCHPLSRETARQCSDQQSCQIFPSSSHLFQNRKQDEQGKKPVEPLTRSSGSLALFDSQSD